MNIHEDTKADLDQKNATNAEFLPKLITLQTGTSFKVLEVTGREGMQMPLHYCTKEAVIIVQEGRALLNIDDREHILSMGSTFVIPAQKNHTLSINSDFKALVIMELDAKIEFAM